MPSQLQAKTKGIAGLSLFSLSLALVLASMSSSPARGQATAEAAATSSASSVVASSPKPVTVAGGKAKPAPSKHMPVSGGASAEEANRKSYEEQAGKNAGKLMMHSVPSGAQIYVNGLYVGHAPLLLLLAPGKYKVEMRGSRQEYGLRTIGLAPNETQELIVTLASEYPNHVTTH